MSGGEVVFISDAASPSERARLFTAWLADLIRCGDLSPADLAGIVIRLRVALMDNESAVRFARLLDLGGI